MGDERRDSRPVHVNFGSFGCALIVLAFFAGGALLKFGWPPYCG